jgi:hypothetical protein
MNSSLTTEHEHQQAGLDQLVQGLSDTDITRSSASQSLKRPNPILAKLGYGDDGPSAENVHSIFAAGLERRRRAAISFSSDTKDGEEAEPPTKRRRYQRRNSKTSAMLFSSMNFLSQDLFDDDNATANKSAEDGKGSVPRAPQDDDADWDGGLEIAEQLVKHLQKRRLSDVSA